MAKETARKLHDFQDTNGNEYRIVYTGQRRQLVLEVKETDALCGDSWRKLVDTHTSFDDLDTSDCEVVLLREIERLLCR